MWISFYYAILLYCLYREASQSKFDVSMLFLLSFYLVLQPLTQVRALVWPLNNKVTLGQSLSLSEYQCSHLSHRSNKVT